MHADTHTYPGTFLSNIITATHVLTFFSWCRDLFLSIRMGLAAITFVSTLPWKFMFNNLWYMNYLKSVTFPTHMRCKITNFLANIVTGLTLLTLDIFRSLKGLYYMNIIKVTTSTKRTIRTSQPKWGGVMRQNDYIDVDVEMTSCICQSWSSPIDIWVKAGSSSLVFCRLDAAVLCSFTWVLHNVHN